MKVPALHIVATDDVAARRGFAELAAEILGAGGAAVAVHLRLRGSTGSSHFHLAEILSLKARNTGGWCVVNGRIDVALVARAQAVQLGHGALSVLDARQILGHGVAIGVSVHSADEAGMAAERGADFLLAGTVFETATHPGFAAAGPAVISDCAAFGAPVVGSGGIDPDHAASGMEAGASGVAVVRAVWERDDPLRAALEMLDVVRAVVEGGADSTDILPGKGEC